MTISRLVLPLAAILTIGSPWLPFSGFGISEAHADHGHGGSGGGGASGSGPGPSGGGGITGGGGGITGGTPGGAVAGRIGGTPIAAPIAAARAAPSPTAGAGNGFSGTSSGSSGITTAARGFGNSDPESAFRTSAVAVPFANLRDAGKVELVSSFQDKDGRACREYRETVTMDGSPVAATGKVCELADGHWALTD
jgi:hypothetical protein